MDGNCLLSKCSGIGNDTIKIIVPKELVSVSGTITFSYGDEKCKYETIDVFVVNDCYISTIPSYTICEEGNVLVIPYYKINEVLNMTVLSNGIWTIYKPINCRTIINGDNLTIVPTSKMGGSFEISPNIGCKDNIVYVKLKYLG